MSRVGKRLIKIPEGIVLEIKEREMIFRNEKGELRVPILEGIKPVFENGCLGFSLLREDKQSKSNWGTNAALAKNAVLGLTEGFKKTLILEGVGYRMNKEGEDLVMNLGFSHPVRYSPPKGIVLELERNNILHIKGVDKALVGQVAAEIRALKKPEPYKGKGFRYVDEVIRRKAGKKAASGS